jgi:hypothetical protein
LLDDPDPEPDPYNLLRIRIREAQKLTDLDPEHWFSGKMKMRLGERSPAGAGQENQENRTQQEVKASSLF